MIPNETLWIVRIVLLDMPASYFRGLSSNPHHIGVDLDTNLQAAICFHSKEAALSLIDMLERETPRASRRADGTYEDTLAIMEPIEVRRVGVTNLVEIAT